MARDQQVARLLWTKSATIVGVLLEIDEQADRLAMAAAARQLRGVERVEFSIGGEHQELRRSFRRRTRSCSSSSALKASDERSSTCPFSARIQPFFDTTTVIGSRSTIASSMRQVVDAPARRRSRCGACRAVSSARTSSRRRAICPRDRLPLLVFGASTARCPFPRAGSYPRCDRHLLELAQSPQPHVENGVRLDLRQLERLHQRLLRLVFGRG